MTKAIDLKAQIQNGDADHQLARIYSTDKKILDHQKKRYMNAIDQYISLYGNNEISIYSAPGRTEIIGNHTDHNNGLAVGASVSLDAIAVVSKTTDNTIELKSENHDFIKIDLTDLEIDESQINTGDAIVKGIANGFKINGYHIGGFNAYTTSDVLTGSGLSSSAAFEILVGEILNHLYNNETVPKIQLAKIGQYAENVYFGKPCGLLDQLSSTMGGFVMLDFKDSKNPGVDKIDFNFDDFDCSLCIIDTKSGHADLTDEYAAIPGEMKAVAKALGSDTLRNVEKEDFYKNFKILREKLGDRPVLRAWHFYNENERVVELCESLKSKDFDTFKTLIIESGKSSFDYLQNVFSCKYPNNQGMSIILALCEKKLSSSGAYRPHGGGFGGTVAAFVKNEDRNEFIDYINGFVGDEVCIPLSIRSIGSTRVL